jgi:hypothetical protein
MLFEDLIALTCRDEHETLMQLEGLCRQHRSSLRPCLPARYDSVFAEAGKLVGQVFGAPGGDRRLPDDRPPQLLYSIGSYNLVAYSGSFFAVPQSLGPIDLQQEDVSGRPGVFVATELSRLELTVNAAIRMTA